MSLVIILLAFLTTFVVPKFAELYSGLDAGLPPITVAMLAIGSALRDYLPFVVIGVLGSIAAIAAWSRSPRGAEFLDSVKLATPFLGEIWLKYQVAQFARMLSTLLTGGIPLVAALETVGQSFQIPLISEALETSS